MKQWIRANILQIQPYKPGKPNEELERELGLTQTLKLASNENCLGPSPLALEAIKENFEKCHLYPDGGAYYLIEKLAAATGFPASQISVGNGSSEVITLLALMTSSQGDSIVMSAQSFIMYKLSAQIAEAEYIETPLKKYGHDLEAMAGAVRENTRIIFIDNPINPTGTYVTREQMDRFFDSVPADVLVVVDEAYKEYIDKDDYPDATEYIKEGKNVAVLRTFSKVYGLAGLRIGYCIAQPEVIEGLNKIRPPFNTSSLAQKAASAALDDTEHVERSKELTLKEMSFLERELTRRRYDYVPSVANFILVDIGMDARKVFEKLLPFGVIVRPMHGYHFPTSIRVSIGSRTENERFLEALDNMGNCGA
ncbi:histidinol-phosphate transaminase [Acidobacteriota bacterium]